MPELPDVEGHRRLVDAHAKGHAIRHVAVPDPELLTGTSPSGLGRSLTGRVIASPRRHGKWLIVPTDGDDGPRLVFHFRMTGELAFGEERHPADVLVLGLDHGELAYRSERRLGGVSYLRAGRDLVEVTGPLGPDAAELDVEGLGGVLDGTRGAVKGVLMDQERVAGLGNELVDEILWRAGIHPRRRAAEVAAQDLPALHRELRVVLGQSIRAGHVPSGPTWLNGQRSADEPRCPRCERPLERARVAGRTTFWCARDQAEPA